ncbi:hypothetical protein CBR_g52574 [Chara braunii]|uniref:Protein kinase domain-containing protein n=1 Tax=Chara braunii TaxID=69332 RepID=A0A388MAF7_CHABU|nr:hypothetical protein CBR_g52574 [Chara braunii]|eukprot:GBG91540.1 hypothetical protein CBR_g52574 [Chara braunii]
MVSLCEWLLVYRGGNHISFPFCILLLLLLLFTSTSSTAIDTAAGLGLTPGGNGSEKQVYQDSEPLNSTLESLSIIDGNLLRYLGDVLERRTDRSALTRTNLILAISVSSDGKSVYFSEEANVTGNRDGLIRGSVVRKAQWTDAGNGSGYIISDVAGPWPKDEKHRDKLAYKGTDVSGLLVLNDQDLIVSRKYNNRLSKINVFNGTEVDYWNITLPLGIAKPPSENVLIVSNQDRINKVYIFTVPSYFSDVVQSIAGPQTNLSMPGHQDYPTAAGVRFRDPLMGPQSITRDGRYLYVLDYWSGSLREVVVATGATRTIAGGANATLHYGIPEVFNESSMCIVTEDGCNLLVTGYGRIYWAPLSSVGGDIKEIKIVATLPPQQGKKHGDLMAMFLMDDHSHLFVGTGDGRMFQLQVNVSALHDCSPSQAAPRSLILIVGLCSGFAVFALCGGGLALVVVTVSRRRRRRRRESQRTTADLKQDRKSAKNLLGGRASTVSSQTVGSTGSSMQTPKPPESLAMLASPSSSLMEFSLLTLERAISQGSCVTARKGGYGHVHRASLVVGEEKTEVAIKVMAGEFSEMKLRQFKAEVTTLGGVRHRNLCKLLGYCTEGDSFMLVYPYISGGSLHSYLHPEHLRTRDRLFRTSEESLDYGKLPLRWTERISIAKQIATCLRYLHHETERPIVHRDVKSSNVLIEGRGKKLRAYLSDFGLAKPGKADRNEGEVMTGHTTVPTQTRAGTPGYMPPEYVFESKLTMSSDVFAYGVVLIELLTGLPAVLRPREGDSVPLYSWARHWEDIDLLIDDDLKMLLTPEEKVMATDILLLALHCTDDSASNRPTMHDVVQHLNLIMKGVCIDSMSSDGDDVTGTATQADTASDVVAV